MACALSFIITVITAVAGLIGAVDSGVITSSVTSRAGKERHHKCHYGSQPGRMEVVDERASIFKWQTFDWACQISNELNAVFPKPLAPAGNDTAEKMLGVEISRTKPNISVVTLGDSVDRNMHYAVQGFVHARGAKVNSVVVPVEGGAFEGRDIYAMLAERMTLITAFIPGVHATAPFHRGMPQSMSMYASIPRALDELHKATGSSSPHLLILGSQLWDVARWYQKEDINRHKLLPIDLLEEYMSDLTTALRAVAALQDMVSDQTVLIYHSAAFPKTRNSSESDLLLVAHEGRRAYYHQLAAAARHVLSREPRWHLVDYQQMSAVFHQDEHLIDALHPAPWFMLEAFNIYLNILKHEHPHRRFHPVDLQQHS